MTNEEYCTCCGRKLNPKTMVELEMNANDGKYYEVGKVPESESQGCFMFGKACAKKVVTKV